MGVIYVGYFDNEINRVLLHVRLEMMSGMLKTFFISGHTSLTTTNKQHPTTSEAVICNWQCTVWNYKYLLMCVFLLVYYYFFCLTNKNFSADVRYLWAAWNRRGFAYGLCAADPWCSHFITKIIEGISVKLGLRGFFTTICQQNLISFCTSPVHPLLVNYMVLSCFLS